jgi:hypothetical protein
MESFSEAMPNVKVQIPKEIQISNVKERMPNYFHVPRPAEVGQTESMALIKRIFPLREALACLSCPDGVAEVFQI